MDVGLPARNSIVCLAKTDNDDDGENPTYLTMIRIHEIVGNLCIVIQQKMVSNAMSRHAQSSDQRQIENDLRLMR